MSDHRRILRGVAANLASIATRILVQFATLPIFFVSWNAERVGTWLIVFAVPAYIALVGPGLAGACGAAALAAARDNDMSHARGDFRTSWSIRAVATAMLALLFAGMAMFTAPSLIAPGDAVAIMDVAAAAAWLGLYIFATSQMAAFDIPFRVAGRYPDHIFLYNAASLVEIVVIAAAVTFSDSLATLAMCLALTRCMAAAAIYLAARNASPEMFDGPSKPARNSLGELWKPSLAFMLMPLVFGINLQGYVLVVGAGFGAVVLAGFVATRTLTRLLDLFTNMSYAIQYYEGGYLESDRQDLQRRLLATMTLVSLVVSLLFGSVLLAIGAWLQDFYTLGQTAFNPAVAVILIGAATLRALSAAPVAVLAADNRHACLIEIYLTGSIAALLLSIALLVVGVPLHILVLPLVIAEASQLIPALTRALKALEWSFAEYCAQIISRERAEDVRNLAFLLKPKP